MSRAIPILPCKNINEQCEFYENAGFTVTAKYISPNAYAVVEFKDICLHFWGGKKHEPLANASMVFVEVDDANSWNEEICNNIKKHQGKIPRTGIPRISKVRELKDDRRFTLCDPSGNTLYFGTPSNGKDVPLRTLDNEKHAKTFAAIYDLLHSRENPEMAARALSKFICHKDELSISDKEKLDILTTQIEEAMSNGND